MSCVWDPEEPRARTSGCQSSELRVMRTPNNTNGKSSAIRAGPPRLTHMPFTLPPTHHASRTRIPAPFLRPGTPTMPCKPSCDDAYPQACMLESQQIKSRGFKRGSLVVSSSTPLYRKVTSHDEHGSKSHARTRSDRRETRDGADAGAVRSVG
jgi:hypothetical protein